jgi:hypothetical protein
MFCGNSRRVLRWVCLTVAFHGPLTLRTTILKKKHQRSAPTRDFKSSMTLLRKRWGRKLKQPKTSATVAPARSIARPVHRNVFSTGLFTRSNCEICARSFRARENLLGFPDRDVSPVRADDSG